MNQNDKEKVEAELKATLDKFVEIVRKDDVAAYFVLTKPGATLSGMVLDPNWSGMKMTQVGNNVVGTLEFKSTNYEEFIAESKKTVLTVIMLEQLAKAIATDAMTFIEIVKQTKAMFEKTVGPSEEPGEDSMEKSV